MFFNRKNARARPVFMMQKTGFRPSEKGFEMRRQAICSCSTPNLYPILLSNQIKAVPLGGTAFGMVTLPYNNTHK